MAYGGHASKTKGGKCLDCGERVHWQRTPYGWTLYNTEDKTTIHGRGKTGADCGGTLRAVLVVPMGRSLPSTIETSKPVTPSTARPAITKVPPVTPRTIPDDALMTLEYVCAVHPDISSWQRAEKLLLRASSRVLLYGPPGTGKTSLAWHMAQQHGWTHAHETLTEETPGSALLGGWRLQGGETVWCDGAVVRAWRESQAGPTVLVLNEITRASVDAMSMALLCLDDPNMAEIILPTGECVRPNPANLHVLATSNDSPSDLTPALASRLPIQIHIATPHPGIVASLADRSLQNLALAKSREYDMRALLACSNLIKEGEPFKAAAYLVWDEPAAQSITDAHTLRLSRLKAGTKVETGEEVPS